MEVGLRATEEAALIVASFSFNPCFNGSWSESIGYRPQVFGKECFNPCFNGSWSERLQQDLEEFIEKVFQSLF